MSGSRTSQLLIRRIRQLQWILLPLIVLVFLEFSLRRGPWVKQYWYSRAETVASKQKIDFLFIGSSKVAAAVHVPAFEASLSKAFQRRVVSMNLGQGYSTIHMHFLGIRNLLQNHPDALKNTICFIEAFEDVPLYEYHAGWESRWVKARPQLLASLLRRRDLVTLWYSKDTIDSKITATVSFLLSDCYLATYRELIRNRCMQESRRLVEQTADALAGPGDGGNHRGTVFQPAGGIKADPASITRIKARGIRYFNSLSRKKQPVLENWSGSILGQLILMIKERGGMVTFVNMPSHSLQRAAYRTEIHERNRCIFKRQLAEWDSLLLTPGFRYSDADIPDAYHLASSRAGEFSRALAKACLENRSRLLPDGHDPGETVPQ